MICVTKRFEQQDRNSTLGRLVATREFTDKSARRWTVWAVHPTTVAKGRHVAVQAEFARGWLTCETPGEKRRIAPIPAGWESMSDAELETLCVQGMLVRPTRRTFENGARTDTATA